MSASRLNPNVYNGQERSSGYIARNDRPRSASSPDWRGRIYLVGVGWYWISGWLREGRGGPLLSLCADEMTDEQCEKFCAQRVRKTEKSASPEDDEPTPGNGQSSIPF